MKSKRGLTLVELVVSTALIGLIIALSFNILVPTIKLPDKSINEYNIQSKIRLLSYEVTETIRDASATFALYRSATGTWTQGWNYIIVSDDHTQVEQYLWNNSTKTHTMKVLVEPQSGVTFSLVFVKLNPPNKDNLLDYRIIATVNGQNREIHSEVEALNSLQVIDRGNTTNKANTLAYRNDPRPTQVADAEADVAIVFDTSYSMDSSFEHSTRLAVLKSVAVNQLLKGLAKSPNVYASAIPFDTTANGDRQMKKVQANSNGDINSALLTIINNSSTGGSTNTGDGLRQGYYSIRDRNLSTSKQTKNFLIVLSDGCTNTSSMTSFITNNSGTPTAWNYFVSDGNLGTTSYTTISRNLNKNDTRGFPVWSGSSEADDSLNLGQGYVNKIGSEYILAYNSGNTKDSDISCYVIAYATGGAYNTKFATLANAISGNTAFYSADSQAALDQIFTDIGKTISDSLWHIGGPN
jgi:hypothetical protein